MVYTRQSLHCSARRDSDFHRSARVAYGKLFQRIAHGKTQPRRGKCLSLRELHQCGMPAFGICFAFQAIFSFRRDTPLLSPFLLRNKNQTAV